MLRLATLDDADTTYPLSMQRCNLERTFLNERTFNVSINGNISHSKAAVSGVPHGPMLGPILFLLYLNALPGLLQGDVLLFADAVKLISARANFDDLQHELYTAWDWALTWDLPLNENKCGQISIGSAPTRPLTLSDNGASIKILDSTKDLGLMIDNTFKPSIHCGQAFNKARSALFLIWRSFVTLTPDIFIPLYSTLVRPHLEYAIQASSPYLRKMLITWSAFNVWLPECLKVVGVCPTRSDSKS